MTKLPNDVDVAVGARLRMRRKQLGLSQESVGKGLGISFQQVQKYEKGTNRVGASRLQAVARVLEVPVSYFFPDESEFTGASLGELQDLLDTPGAVQILKAYAAIDNSALQKAVLNLMLTIETPAPPRPAVERARTRY